MKKLKFKLDALREEMEILNMDDLISTKGGGAAGYYGYSTWEDFLYAVDRGDVPDGTYFPDGVSGGYGVHGNYGTDLTWLHLDSGYGTWNAGGGYGGYGGSAPESHIHFMNDSQGSYLIDDTLYISEYGHVYHKVSLDGGATWTNQVPETPNIYMPEWTRSTFYKGSIETYAINASNATSYLTALKDAGPSVTQSAAMSLAGIALGYLNPEVGAYATLVQVQMSITQAATQAIYTKYTAESGGSGLFVTIVSRDNPDPNVNMPLMFVTFKDGNGKELGTINL